MKRGTTYILLIGAMVYFSACTRTMICPAYHSYFILDVNETRKTFTLFGTDSLPKKRWEIDREKYGIAKDIPDQKKRKEMRIISMNSIYKKLEDPMDRMALAESDSALAAIQVGDTTGATAQSEAFNDFDNIDQMIYLHHFGKYLPKKGGSTDEFKEDLMQQEAPLVDESSDNVEETPKKKRKLWPFGKKGKKTGDGNPEGSEDQVGP